MERLDKVCVLNGAQLKWIAMASMLIDHANKGIVFNLLIIKGVDSPALNVASNIMEVLGRVAFPIFLFLLVEGFTHTRSRKNYLMYLLGFGVLSEVPYDMFESGEYWDMGGQNMYFTLALALMTIWAMDSVKEKGIKLWWLFAGIIVILGAGLSAWLGLDYTYYGILIPVIFYLAGTHRIIGSIASYLVIIKEIWSFTGFILVNMYNGERGKINKWFCYAFYPAHLLLIGAIRMYIMKC